MALLEAALIDDCKETIARGGGDTIRLQPDSDDYERVCLGTVELNWEFTYKLSQYTRFGLDLPAKTLLVNAIEKIDKATQSRMSAGLSSSFKKKKHTTHSRWRRCGSLSSTVRGFAGGNPSTRPERIRNRTTSRSSTLNSARPRGESGRKQTRLQSLGSSQAG